MLQLTLAPQEQHVRPRLPHDSQIFDAPVMAITGLPDAESCIGLSVLASQYVGQVRVNSLVPSICLVKPRWDGCVAKLRPTSETTTRDLRRLGRRGGFHSLEGPGPRNAGQPASCALPALHTAKKIQGELAASAELN